MGILYSMGDNLASTSLNFTHPKFESMYGEWSMVNEVGNQLIDMDKSFELNELQAAAFEDVKNKHLIEGYKKVDAIQTFFSLYKSGRYNDQLKSDEEFYKVLMNLSIWALDLEW